MLRKILSVFICFQMVYLFNPALTFAQAPLVGISNKKSDGTFDNKLSNAVTRTAIQTDRWISNALVAAMVATLGSSFLKYGIEKLAMDFWMAAAGSGIMVAGDVMTFGMYKGMLDVNIKNYRDKTKGEENKEEQINVLMAQRQSYNDVKIMLETRRNFYLAGSAAMALGSMAALGIFAALWAKFASFANMELPGVVSGARASGMAKAESECAGATAGQQACAKGIEASQIEPPLAEISAQPMKLTPSVFDFSENPEGTVIKSKKLSAAFIEAQNNIAKNQANPFIGEGATAAFNLTGVQKLSIQQTKMELNSPLSVPGVKNDIEFEKLKLFLNPLNQAYASGMPTDVMTMWLNGMTSSEGKNAKESIRNTPMEVQAYNLGSFAGVGMGAIGVAIFHFFGGKLSGILDYFWGSPKLRAAIYGTASALIMGSVAIQTGIIMQMDKNIKEIEGMIRNLDPNYPMTNLGQGHSVLKEIINTMPPEVRENIGVKDGMVIPCPGNTDGRGTCNEFPTLRDLPMIGLPLSTFASGASNTLGAAAHHMAGKKKTTDQSLDAIDGLAKAARKLHKEVDLLKKHIGGKYPQTRMDNFQALQDRLLGDIKAAAKEAIEKNGGKISDGFAGLFSPTQDIPLANSNDEEKGKDKEMYKSNSTTSIPATESRPDWDKNYNYAGPSQDDQLASIANKDNYDYSSGEQQKDIHEKKEEGIFDIITLRYFKTAYPLIFEEVK